MKKLKKKKGFTLIELLAVIVILAIILVIAFPQVMNKITNTKVASYSSQLELIKRAADVYRIQYIEEIADTNNVEITIAQLKEKELIPESIINPITKEEFADDMIVKITTVAGVETFELVEAEKGPELATGMIPVYYDEINMVWKKADKTTDDWYDYDAFKWANAVTVTSGTRDAHNAAAVGTTIPMTDINTMFVWIPRYKYRIPSGTGPREIDVVFETKDIAKSNGDAVSTYYTHPAFTAGIEELSGIWVGKFETTGTIAAPTIKPDEISLRSQTIKAMYDSVKTNMQGNVTFGFTNDNDTHMMKNMEWGAVTYLYYSKYGKFGNPIFVGVNKELYLNNSSSYYTGRSKGKPGGGGPFIPSNEFIAAGNYTYDGKCASIYTGITECATGAINQTVTDKTFSYGASTTGTIYGVYDMSGGTNEYVMGMYMPNPIPATGISDQSGYSTSSTNSQYNLLNIDAKYYDRYLTSLYTTGAILGDATKEVYYWYDDHANFVNGSPWFIRGGGFGHASNAGAFYFSLSTGAQMSLYSFRIVLWP